MEDLLDDESIRKKIEVLEQQDAEKEKKSSIEERSPAENKVNNGSD